jgi:hypothetical protein
MKAVVVEEHGGVDKLIYKDVPKPTADKGTVVIKNHCSGKKILSYVIAMLKLDYFIIVIRRQLY